MPRHEVQAGEAHKQVLCCLANERTSRSGSGGVKLIAEHGWVDVKVQAISLALGLSHPTLRLFKYDVGIAEALKVVFCMCSHSQNTL